MKFTVDSTIVAAFANNDRQYLLRNLFYVACLIAGFFDKHWQKDSNTSFQVNLISTAKYLPQQLEYVLDDERGSMSQEIDDNMAIPGKNVRNKLRIELTNASDHGDTLKTISPMHAFDA